MSASLLPTPDNALRMSEARYRRLFESAQDGILILNATTAQIDDVNPFLIELLGYSHAEFLGKKLWEIGAFKDTFSHLSASIVLSRKRASEGLYPAIDPLQSNSKMATPGVIGARHYALAQEIRHTLAQYAGLKDIIAMLGLEQLSSEDRKVVARARRLERFLTQPFFTTEQFTGLKGKLVSLDDALDGCERILRDEFKDVPESALYMIGAIAEAIYKAPKEDKHAVREHAA